MELYDFFLSLNNLEIAVLLFCSCVGFGVFYGLLSIGKANSRPFQ